MDFGDSDFLKEEKENENRKMEIKDALTCFICTAKILDPMMCPQCKKLVCTKCIKRWFVDQQHQKCPFCQVQCSFNQMIALPFMNQLSEYFIKEIDANPDRVYYICYLIINTLRVASLKALRECAIEKAVQFS